MLKGRITSITGEKYSIQEFEFMKSMINEASLCTSWKAVSKNGDKVISLFVKCDYFLPTSKDFTGIDETKFKSEFSKILLDAFTTALFYESIKDANEIKFSIDQIGDNLLGFRYKKIKDKIEFEYTHPQKPNFQHDLNLLAQCEILGELHKEYRKGFSLKKIDELLFLNKDIVEDCLGRLKEDVFILEKGGKIYITEKGEGWKEELLTKLEEVRSNNKSYGF